MHSVIIEMIRWFLHRAPREARRAGVGWLLTYNPVMKGLSQVLWLFPVAIVLVWIHSPPDPEDRWGMAAFAVGITIGCIVLSLEVFKREIELTESWITQKSAWSKPKKILWKDVADVGWNMATSETVVKAKDGRSIRVSVWLSGMETFAAMLENRLPHVPKAPVVARRVLAYIDQ